MDKQFQSLASSFQFSVIFLVLFFVWGATTAHAQQRSPTFSDQSTVDSKAVSTQNIVGALDLKSSQVLSVDFVGSDQVGYTTFSQVASSFPQEGKSYLTLSSGDAGAALDPDNSGSFSYQLTNGLTGPGDATDMVRMELELDVPSDAATIKFDLKYLSEEFPEFVGSNYNDSFVVEMGESTFTVDGSDLIAPDNLVFDADGNPLTVNTTGATGMSSGGSVGTTYDGGTDVLTTTIQIPPGKSTVKLIFSIFDVGDKIYDSTIFVDNMRFQESQNLELVGLEANQAIQDWQNSVELIENKSTTVRAFIQSQSSSSAPVGNVRLRGVRNGSPLPGSPLSPSNGGFQAPPQTSDPSTIRDRRADMSKSLNFQLPSSWRNGTVDLQLTGGTVDCSPAAATNDVCEVQVSFTSVPTPSVRFARIRWTDSGGNTHMPSQAHVREQALRIIAMYPLPSMNWSTFTLDWDTWSGGSGQPSLSNVNSALQTIRGLSILFGGSSSTMYYGDMVGTNNGGLAAGIPADVASGDQQVADNVAAHELGHVLNQQHSVNQGDNGTTMGSSGTTWKLGYCGPNRAVANTSAPEYPFTNSAQNIAALGPTNQGQDSEMWGVDTRTNQAVDMRNHGDLMSYCAFNFGFNWPSSWRYNKLRTDPDALDDRFSSTALAGASKQQVSNYKLMRGQVDLEENTAEFNSFIDVEAEQSNVETITPPAGDYTLRLLDASDTVIDDVEFAPAENHGFGTEVPETATFLVPVSENAEISEVQLLGPDGGGSANQQASLATVTASSTAPTITVDFPNGGEELTGETSTFEWSANDEDGDELTYTVEYSRDGGASWTTLVTDWPETSLQVDLSSLGQTEQGLIRARASDGFYSTSDNSDESFTVPNSPPQPYIITPDGASFDSTTTIPLEGEANDLEDDQIDSNNFSWNSSLDGSLGTGRSLDVEELSVGTHTITLSVTDSDGKTSAASIELTVTLSAETSPSEQPVASESILIDSDGPASFGGTGVKIDFANVSSSDEVTVEKYDSAPVGGSEIPKENVSQFRYVINAGPDLSFGEETELRFLLDNVSGVGDNIAEGDIHIYSRPEEGTGEFAQLTTMLDDKGDDDPSNDEIYATVGSFSEFAFASDSEPLPVEMAGFEGTVVNEGQVRLTWQTTSETNNSGFEVQRKAGNESGWTKVGFVEGQGGNSAAEDVQSYQFQDSGLPFAADKLEYRLRQVDTDGSSSLSDSVQIQRTVDEVQLRSIFPNPARTGATVRFAVPQRQKVTLEMYDVLGRRVQVVASGEQEGRREVQVDVSDLPSGMYFLRLRAEGTVKTERMTVVH